MTMITASFIYFYILFYENSFLGLITFSSLRALSQVEKNEIELDNVGNTEFFDHRAYSKTTAFTEAMKK